MSDKLSVCTMTSTEHARVIAESVPEEDIRKTLSTLWNRRPVSELDVSGIEYWMGVLKLALEMQAGTYVEQWVNC